MDQSEKRTLILDGEWESALAIVRSLGSKRVRVEVGARERRCIASRSRYCEDHFVYPDPLTDLQGFRNCILKRVASRDYALVMPVTDLTICPLRDIRQQVEQHSLLAMAPSESIAAALSKSRTCELAEQLAIPCPETVIVRELDELTARPRGFSYPVVVKPEQSKTWSAADSGHENTVTYAFDESELIEKVSTFLPFGPVTLQEYVSGHGIGIGVLARDGDVLHAFQHRRLHELPLTGGASSYRISEALDPELLDYSTRLIAALQWNGVAMVEFKRNRTSGQSALMEVNGRFWGSLPLAVAAGADFPFTLYQMLVHSRTEFDQRYRVGVRCRHLGKDLEWVARALGPKSCSIALAATPSRSSVLRDSARMLAPTDYVDTWNTRDLRPGFHDLARIASRVTKYAGARWRWSLEKRRMARIQSHPDLLIEKLRNASGILLLCSGNFIRSSFAERLVNRRLGDTPRTVSAGLQVLPGRKGHRLAIARANELGCDLDQHRAQPATPEMIESADLIFVMEMKHMAAVRERYPVAHAKTFLLGCLAPGYSVEIADPDSKPVKNFERCFAQLEAAVNVLVNARDTAAQLSSPARPKRQDSSALRRPRGWLGRAAGTLASVRALLRIGRQRPESRPD
jgi:protein-tyrosine-phosphatase/predicted ATP-grasp superfamily ATP-dependent carboligase